MSPGVMWNTKMQVWWPVAYTNAQYKFFKYGWYAKILKRYVIFICVDKPLNARFVYEKLAYIQVQHSRHNTKRSYQ